jgi:hypothetical protein
MLRAEMLKILLQQYLPTADINARRLIGEKLRALSGRGSRAKLLIVLV